MSDPREARIVDTFLTLIDTLVDDFDALDMMTMLAEQATELLGVSDAGVILADAPGSPGLTVAAASSERPRLAEVLSVAADGGPSVECARSGEPASFDDVDDLDPGHRWTRYAHAAAAAGFRATHALPMRLRGEVIGVLTLLHTERHVLDAVDTRLGQSFAHAATVGLLHERAVRRAETVQEQLQGALNSRVVVEQAKGVLAQRAGLTPDDAFVVIRRAARRRGERLTDLARGIVGGSTDLTDLTPGSAPD